MRYSVIIPCYNEEENIDYLIQRIRPLQKKYDLEYILVENGSEDESKSYFKDNVEGKYKNIKVAYVEINRGYGYGIQQGMKIAEGEYVGWIHADLQIPPEELGQFFDEIEKHGEADKLFLKGQRTNRKVVDKIFTIGQSVFSSILFQKKIYDVGAIPVLFHRSLMADIEAMPNDFSIEVYVYVEAILRGFNIKRCTVKLLEREKGTSSWNNGLKSRLRQSKKIIRASIQIKKGEKVL